MPLDLRGNNLPTLIFIVLIVLIVLVVKF